MRVLIVEDDFIGSRLMKKFLEADCFCHLAFDGREAIDAFEGTPVLSDDEFDRASEEIAAIASDRQPVLV